ncbi:MAG: hypothetical protein HYT72_05570 [Candidatus Aenigmarchaeota archaeon]|nr:hypothetical protein [Candidatus Aenigmarchaeota archaeon]
MKFLGILIVVIALISGCVQQTELREITIPGHANQVYVFSYDIRESIKVQAPDEAAIRNLLRTDSINILYNGTNEQDLAYFNVALFNIREKLRTFYTYDGILLKFYPFYYTTNELVNFSNASISNPTIEIRGPDTGATETSVILNGKTVLVQGTTSRNLQLAADRLVLAVFDIDETKIDALARR